MTVMSALHASHTFTARGFLVQLEGLGQLKNAMTSLGIKPMTFQLVALCLNQLCYCVPPCESSTDLNFCSATVHIKVRKLFPHTGKLDCLTY
jgi:hypothetical protein